MRPFEACGAAKFHRMWVFGPTPYGPAAASRTGRSRRGGPGDARAHRLGVIIMLMALGSAARGQVCPSGEAARQALLARAQAQIADDGIVALAIMSASADLGFTLTDPPRSVGRGGWLAVWKRGADCAWRAMYGASAPDGAMPAEPDIGTARPIVPPPHGTSLEAGPRAVDEFERVAGEDGVADALHIYALDAGFVLLAGPSTRAALKRANRYLIEHPWRGVWRDAARDSSADGTLLSATGALVDARGVVRRRYLQVWQYDPKVANWGLRVLWSGKASDGE